MLYLINFTFNNPTTGQTYNFKGIKEGQTPGEASYYFKLKYPNHDINITSIEQIIFAEV